MDDFEKKNNSDFKLQRVEIGQIYYYDDDDNRLFNAELSLFGKTCLIDSFTEYMQSYKHIRVTSDKFSYRLIRVEDGLIVIELGSAIIHCAYDSYLEIVNYNNRINSVDIMECDKLANEIVELVNKYRTNDDVILMLNNFYDAIPRYIFLNTIFVIQVEACIVNDYSNSGYMPFLLSDEIDRATYSKIVTNKIGNKSYESILTDNEDTIKPYYNNDFKNLVDLMKEIIGVDSVKSTYFVYLMLQEISKENAISIWVENHSSSFADILFISIEDAVDRFFDIDTIEHDNIETAATFVYFLMKNNKFKNNHNFIKCYNEFLEIYVVAEKKYNAKQLKNRLLKKPNSIDAKKIVSIDDIDVMNGTEFELFISLLFSKMQYSTLVTKHSGDQGIDVIAEKNGTRMGIQAKCYSCSVGNSAIQEAVAGKNYYKLDKVLVVTNNYFTNSAKELAYSNDVILWNRDKLKEKILIIQ
ncbi:MAG: restriction endonuclease [Candidatus Cloacimonetes bacterium]|nr:restriction endonuclease [Candidatus Cloacimonadota bacterium]